MKRWKAVQGIGCLGALVGIGLFFLAVGLLRGDRANPPVTLSGVAVGLILVGSILYFVGRALVWWHRD
jgi:hypothetical protein